ncbi:DUF2975 domain-containing protein [Microbacterium sp. HA-8]|uniref:DUF2975 domain-containing protein n=1 Tax=Microbacterium sp. HA-8 TaxID=3234200 RepID=UPI0038F637AC
MGKLLVLVLRVVIALSLAGSLVVQIGIVPALWVDMAGIPLWARINVVTIVVLGVLSMQVFAICVWRLLTMVRRGSVFTPAAFRWVDVIIGTVAAAAAIVFWLAAILAPGGAAPGLVAVIGGFGLVLAGMALLVLVMRTLLRQAIEREAETRALRSELDEVI